jgi:hypothetical protein
MWLEVALVAQLQREDDVYLAGKRRACRFYYECELPRVAAWLAVVASGSDVCAGADPESF